MARKQPKFKPYTDDLPSVVSSAFSAAQEKKDELDNLAFNEEGKLLDDEGKVVEAKDGEPEPMEEDTRDAQCGEIDEFITECENAKSEWEEAEFPGLYG